MRKDASFERRLGHVAALQALKTVGSRAELAEAQRACAEASATLTTSTAQLDDRTRDLEATLASEVLDFDRWKIGRAVVEELARGVDTAVLEHALRANEQQECHVSFGRETAREEQAAALHREAARHLRDKRDGTAALEANALTVLRRLGERK